MDPQIGVALIGAGALIVATWLPTRRAVNRIDSELRPNGGSSVKDQLDRIEAKTDLVDGKVDHLRGRFDQHLTETKENPRVPHPRLGQE